MKFVGLIPKGKSIHNIISIRLEQFEQIVYIKHIFSNKDQSILQTILLNEGKWRYVQFSSSKKQKKKISQFSVRRLADTSEREREDRVRAETRNESLEHDPATRKRKHSQSIFEIAIRYIAAWGIDSPAGLPERCSIGKVARVPPRRGWRTSSRDWIQFLREWNTDCPSRAPRNAAASRASPTFSLSAVLFLRCQPVNRTRQRPCRPW